MKRIIIIMAIIVLASVAFTSCTATKGGCVASRGYVGYGH
jgi:predicted small secreted protein